MTSLVTDFINNQYDLSIVNKLTNGLILHSWSGSASQWKLLYTVSATVAFLPAIFFTLWGSADLQPWAIPKLKQSSESRKDNSDIDRIF